MSNRPQLIASEVAKISRRRKLGPVLESVISTLVVALAIWITLTVIYNRSLEAMEGEIKAGLKRQVSVVARMLDGKLGDAHESFIDVKRVNAPDSLPELVAAELQADTAKKVYANWNIRLEKDLEFKAWRDGKLASPEYRDWAMRIERVRLAAEDTRFAYTNVKIGDKIYFASNMTAQEDWDGDGKIDEAPSLLCPYPDYEPALAKAIETESTQVTTKPYTDTWGTYYSGFAPFKNSENKVVGTIGMDLKLSSYNERLAPLTKAVHIAQGVGMALALLCGILVYWSRARLARITSQLESDRLMLANANAEIAGLNELLKGENLRMGAELEVTRRIQMLTLPKTEELQKANTQLDIAAFVKPADEVGGDYYDVLKDEDRVRIGIGDVTGHGLESGMIMLMTQTAVRTLIDNGITDPQAILASVNRTIYRQVARMGCDRNLTLAMVDYQEGKVTVCGQHEEVLVVRATGEVERFDTSSLGFYVGMLEDIADMLSIATLRLEPGDVLVLYTDGIPEAAEINGSLYGLDRLCEVVRENRALSALEIKDRVIDDVSQYIGKHTVFDDITLVVCKRGADPIPT